MISNFCTIWLSASSFVILEVVLRVLKVDCFCQDDYVHKYILFLAYSSSREIAEEEERIERFSTSCYRCL